MNRKQAMAANVPESVLTLTRSATVFVALIDGKYVNYGFDRGYAKRFSKTVRKLSV